jgi:hypothetical protein
MTNRLRKLFDLFDSLEPGFRHDPPLISIDADGLSVDTGSHLQRYYVRPNEDNGDVWKALEMGGL